MQTIWRYVSLVSLTAMSTAVLAETKEEMQKRILEQTKVVALTELSGPASEYKGDGDPTTLEIVFLTKKSDGPSRVSDDGEVIFLYKASDKVQEKLIGLAFEKRFARVGGT